MVHEPTMREVLKKATLIRPESRGLWDYTIAILAALSILLVPLQVAFDDRDTSDLTAAEVAECP